jgi:hypothetical protein
MLFLKLWSGRADLNCRPSEPHSDALTRLRYAPEYINNRGRAERKSTGKAFNYLMMRLKDVEARPTNIAVARKVTPKSIAIRW